MSNTVSVSGMLATLLVLALSLANMLGLWIIGFGLWPRSWWAVLFFGIINNTVLYALREAVDKETKSQATK